MIGKTRNTLQCGGSAPVSPTKLHSKYSIKDNGWAQATHKNWSNAARNKVDNNLINIDQSMIF